MPVSTSRLQSTDTSLHAGGSGSFVTPYGATVGAAFGSAMAFTLSVLTLGAFLLFGRFLEKAQE